MADGGVMIVFASECLGARVYVMDYLEIVKATVNDVKPKKVYVIHSSVPEALKPLIQKGIHVEIP